MSCSKCKFAVYQDNGYSNWTVEGTDFFCAKKLHPSDGFDTFYGKGPGLEFGDTCTGKVEGEPLCLDVDNENIPTEGEDKIVYDMYLQT